MSERLTDAELEDIRLGGIPNSLYKRVHAQAKEANALAAEVERLKADNHERDDELERRTWFMEARGFRRCDIMACNCNLWHGGKPFDLHHPECPKCPKHRRLY